MGDADDEISIRFTRDARQETPTRGGGYRKANESDNPKDIRYSDYRDSGTDSYMNSSRQRVESSPDSDYNSGASTVPDDRKDVNVIGIPRKQQKSGWTSDSVTFAVTSTGATWPLCEESGSLTVSSRDNSIPTDIKARETISRASVEFPDDDSSSNDSGETKFSLRTITRGQAIILASCCLTNLLCFLSLSVLAPFFPIEAANKNVNSTISGWIFGVFALVQFVSAPLFGNLVSKVGSRFMYIAGFFMTAGCTILFGLLGLIDTSEGITTYVSLCFVTRIVLALGCTAVNNAGLVMLVKAFPDNVGTVFGIGEIFTGIGMVIGPALGGFLYGAGGFILPFAVIGGCCAILFPIVWCTVPFQDDSSVDDKGDLSLTTFLCHPNAIVNSIVVAMSASIWAILDPTLEPHLEVYGLGPEIVGVLFLIMAAFYSVTSPVWGWLADRLPDKRAILIPGFIFAAVGLLLLGPSPILGFDLNFNELWLTIISLIILGVSSSMVVIPTYDIYVDILSDIDYPEDSRSFGMISGLWVSMYALGDFAGPSLAGFLYEEIGFEWLATWVAAGCVLTSLLAGASWFADAHCRKRKSKKSTVNVDEISENTRLLPSTGDDDEDDMMRTYPPKPWPEYSSTV